MSIAVETLENTPVSAGEEDLRQFLSEIRRYPLLTAEEERSLARRCAGGDEEAIRLLVNSNLRLVVSVARKYAGRGVPLLDLIQEGSIGLLAAARRFDYTQDVRFSTYATKGIHSGIGNTGGICICKMGGNQRVGGFLQLFHAVEAAGSAAASRLSADQAAPFPAALQLAAA